MFYFRRNNGLMYHQPRQLRLHPPDRRCTPTRSGVRFLELGGPGRVVADGAADHEGGVRCVGGVPLPTRGGVWEGLYPLLRKLLDFCFQNGAFWRVLKRTTKNTVAAAF